MSYSFTIRASSKQSARALLSDKLDELVTLQAIRWRDAGAIRVGALAVLEAIEDDPTHDVTVTCSGYAGTEGAGLRYLTTNCRAGLAKRSAE